MAPMISNRKENINLNLDNKILKDEKKQLLEIRKFIEKTLNMLE